MEKPLIQIDANGNSREMTEEEIMFYDELWSNIEQPSLAQNAPLPDTTSDPA